MQNAGNSEIKTHKMYAEFGFVYFIFCILFGPLNIFRLFDACVCARVLVYAHSCCFIQYCVYWMIQNQLFVIATVAIFICILKHTTNFDQYVDSVAFFHICVPSWKLLPFFSNKKIISVWLNGISL